MAKRLDRDACGALGERVLEAIRVDGQASSGRSRPLSVRQKLSIFYPLAGTCELPPDVARRTSCALLDLLSDVNGVTTFIGIAKHLNAAGSAEIEGALGEIQNSQEIVGVDLVLAALPYRTPEAALKTAITLTEAGILLWPGLQSAPLLEQIDAQGASPLSQAILDQMKARWASDWIWTLNAIRQLPPGVAREAFEIVISKGLLSPGSAQVAGLRFDRRSEDQAEALVRLAGRMTQEEANSVSGMLLQQAAEDGSPTWANLAGKIGAADPDRIAEAVEELCKERIGLDRARATSALVALALERGSVSAARHVADQMIMQPEDALSLADVLARSVRTPDVQASSAAHGVKLKGAAGDMSDLARSALETLVRLSAERFELFAGYANLSLGSLWRLLDDQAATEIGRSLTRLPEEHALSLILLFMPGDAGDPDLLRLQFANDPRAVGRRIFGDGGDSLAHVLVDPGLGWYTPNTLDARIARDLREAIDTLTESDRSDTLCRNAQYYVTKATPRATRLVVEEILKWPTCDASQIHAMASAVAAAHGVEPSEVGVFPMTKSEINRRALPHFTFDRWKFAKWAKGRGYDVSSPPTRPAGMVSVRTQVIEGRR